MTAILPEGVLGVPVFTQVAVLEVRDIKSTSAVVRELSLKMPVPSLSHLKRVRKLKRKEENVNGDNVNTSAKEPLLVYLTYLKDFDISDVKDTGAENLTSLSESDSEKVTYSLKEKGIDTMLFTSKVFVSKVAKYAPKVRFIYDKVSPFWPCALHEDLYLVRLSSKNLFSKEELTPLIRYMNEALKIGNDVPSTRGEKVGAVIVDSTGSVVGVGRDGRHRHPVQHATMVAIDNVATRQCGGAWNMGIKTDTNISIPCSTEEDKEDSVVTSKRRKISHALSDDSDKAIGKDSYFNEKSSHVPSGGEDTCSEGVSYICTGYDVYLTREPCMMCAMALLHSRVRRVFYRFPNPEVGALESKTKLHTLDGINHRYEVFTVKPK